MCLIIICDNEPELIRLGQKIDEDYCHRRARILMYNQLHEVLGQRFNKVFLVGHANIQSLGGYSVEEFQKGDFRTILQQTRKIYLAGCSTGDVSQQIRRGGFQPSTMANVLQDYYHKAIVYATPGTLILTRYNSLEIDHSTRMQVTSYPTAIFLPANALR